MQPMSKQADKAPKLRALPTVNELAEQRFGKVEGLAIVEQTTLQLATHYAKRFSLDADDPEVSLIASALAFTRHKEFTLLVELERDLFGRVATSPSGETYGQVLFNVTKTGAYRDVHREVDRLHIRAGRYLEELRSLAREEENRKPK